MAKKVNYKISLPEKIKNPSYNVKVIEINGKKITLPSIEPDYYSIKNINILKDGFLKIENLAYSNEQLKSINEFLLNNYYRICTLRLFEDFEYCQWVVYKRYDDLLFYIYEVWGADMKIEIVKHMFPFLGGIINVSEQIKFHPEDFGFEYQFHLYNEIVDE
jgi:hypothetical protein